MTAITLLDGGLGQEINSRSTADKSHNLWSVQVMHNEPQIVVDVHKEFIQAGAKVLTLNNYTATPTRMARWDMGHLFASTHQQAIALMNQAIAESGVDRNSINVAGCLPPIAATYVASAALDYQKSYDEYCQLIEQQQAGVDLFLIETISNIEEAEAAIDALKAYDQKLHVGLTLADHQVATLRSGEPLADALVMMQDKGVDAAMINCSFPEAITAALPTLRDSGLRFGGYANGFTAIEALVPGTTVDNLQARVDLSPDVYTQHALEWIAGGATIVGGCCEISPAHIEHLCHAIEQQGHVVSKLI